MAYIGQIWVQSLNEYVDAYDTTAEIPVTNYMNGHVAVPQGQGLQNQVNGTGLVTGVASSTSSMGLYGGHVTTDNPGYYTGILPILWIIGLIIVIAIVVATAFIVMAILNATSSEKCTIPYTTATACPSGSQNAGQTTTCGQDLIQAGQNQWFVDPCNPTAPPTSAGSGPGNTGSLDNIITDIEMLLLVGVGAYVFVKLVMPELPGLAAKVKKKIKEGR